MTQSPILTVTLNPALDVSTGADHVEPDVKLRCDAPVTDPGGGGINVSRAIIDEWAERGDVTLSELVSHVTVHELAHHFGWSDDDIARIDRWWE